MSFLGPLWLIVHINTISLILGSIILVIFSGFVNKKIIFPIADYTKVKTQGGLNKGSYKGQTFIAKYLPDIISTLIFILYVWLGSFILAEYIIAPILTRVRDILVIIMIIIFSIISWVINSKKIRNMLMRA